MILFHGGRILPCADTTVLDDGAMVVEGDRIAWVGDLAHLPEVYSHLQDVVDVARATVLPGLVDPHAHISFGEALTEEELAIYTPTAYRAIRAGADAQKVLMAGVTTAADPGGPRGIALAVRDAIDAGLIQGPRFSAAGPQMSTQQGIAETMPPWLGQLDNSIGVLVRGADQIRQVIRDDVKDGIDFVKIAGSGPGTTEYASFTFDELNVAVNEAHRLQKPVAIHARTRQAVEIAVTAHVDWIMHASYMDEATLERVLEEDIPLLPALTLLVNSLEGAADILSSESEDRMKRELDAAVSILSKAADAGARLIAGSESGFGMTPFGEWHAREMALFVELLSMKPHDALLCMTRNAEFACPRQRGSVGVLEAGRFADFLVVDGCPDQDVTVLADRKKLMAIYKGGSLVNPWRPLDEPRTQMPYEKARRYVSQRYLDPSHS
jgi:imidazolonepropionase-like amidohydrolase